MSRLEGDQTPLSNVVLINSTNSFHLKHAVPWRNRLQGFADLVASRQTWIADVLKPWCRQARWRELINAQQDWANLAGAIDPQATLWVWAWSRFPALISEDMPGIDETHRVRVITRDGRTFQGFPDHRESRLGKLRLLCDVSGDGTRHELCEPISIDEVMSVEKQ